MFGFERGEMGPSRQTTCEYCRAPLPIAEGVASVACLFCKRQNDLRERAPQAAAAPSGRGKQILSVVAISLASVIFGGFFLYWAVGGDLEPTGETADARVPPPLEFRWVSPSEFVAIDRDTMKGSARITDEGEYQIKFEGFQPGTRWIAGERRGQVRSEVFSIEEVASVRDQFADVPVEELRDYRLGPDETLIIKTGSGREGSLELRPVTAWLAIRSILEQVEDRRPVTFENESEPSDELSLYFGSDDVYGPATTVGEIDLVAIRNRLPGAVGEVICEYEQGYGGPKKRTMLLKESEVVVYDRRTAEVVASNRFAPDAECFELPIGAEETFSRSASRSTIEPWLLELIDEPLP